MFSIIELELLRSLLGDFYVRSGITAPICTWNLIEKLERQIAYQTNIDPVELDPDPSPDDVLIWAKDYAAKHCICVGTGQICEIT